MLLSRTWLPGVLLALALGLAGIGFTAGRTAPEPPPDPVSPRGVSLALSKDTARPGEELDLTIEGAGSYSILRGVDSYLERWDGQDWVPEYALLTPLAPGEAPGVHPLRLGPPIVEQIGLTGPGPERVRLPDDLRPGLYRIRKEVFLEDGDRSERETLFARLQVVQ
ncbi:MAG: hypothetical protein L6E13_00200 [Firmicutes bacterium]|nr:hypothetical protein [Bacillota bacterium]